MYTDLIHFFVYEAYLRFKRFLFGTPNEDISITAINLKLRKKNAAISKY